VIFKAWKKEIYEGSIPVGPAGTTTSTGEVTPTLATVAILLDSIIGINSKTGLSERTIAKFPFKLSISVFNSGIPSVPN